FGQVKILSPAFHQQLVASVMAFAMGNVDMFLGTLVTLGLFDASEQERVRPLLAALMTRLHEQRPMSIDELDFPRLRQEVKYAIEQMDIAVPQELVLYGRTFTLLAGVTRTVAPDVNALAIARPLITQALLAGGPREQAA